MVVSIWITDSCNMKCDYCYEGKKGRKNMPLNYIENIINFINQQQPLSESNILYIKFFGGEPLLNFEFIRKFVMVIGAQNYDIPIIYSITTNGTLLNSEKVQFMTENHFSCSISIDGFPQIHNRHRKMKNGEESWEYIKQHMDSLMKQNELKIIARMTYTPETVSYLSESVIFLVQTGFKEIIAVPDYFNSGWNEENFEKLSYEYGRVREFQKDNSGIDIVLGIRKENILKGYTGCGGGKNTFSINIDGEVYPCTYAVEFPELKLGDIFHLDEYRIPDFSVKTELRKACRGCKYFQLCLSGRCIFLNYKITGNYYLPGDFFCEYQKLEYKYYGV